ncbi:MAG TPA: hypothetical protein DF383_04135 [Deltaproteobacteria bacterium]|nr:hypothetical protein [Deltaproteobacteria bacterium]
MFSSRKILLSMLGLAGFVGIALPPFSPSVLAKAEKKSTTAAQAATKPVALGEAKKKNKKGKAPAESRNQLTREEGRKLTHYNFEIPSELRPAVDFWKLVYSKYDRRQEIFHDTQNLKIIYSVLDFSDLYVSPLSDTERRNLRRTRIDAEKERIRAILLRLGQGGFQEADLSAEEKRIARLFQDDPNPGKFLEAADADRIRSQTGIQDKFIAGLKNCGEYIEEIEEIFSSHGVPTEITRLVFVESMFNTKVRSKVGASGIWQFMPATGKLFLNIDAVADERDDPIYASHAAARLLRDNYAALGTWPLAINAYNSGRATMSRAVAAMGGKNIATIILNYRGGVYGFASRNFFPSFLAALEVANHYPKYFGDLKMKPKLQYEYYTPRNAVFFGQLASLAGAEPSRIAKLNPHFSEGVLADLKKVPAGYRLRIPQGSQARFAQAEDRLLSGVANALPARGAEKLRPVDGESLDLAENPL